MNLHTMIGRLTTCLVLAVVSTATPLIAQQQTWTSDAFTYDAAGNITAIGNNTFFYTAGRLVHGTAEGSSNFQEYSYDSFGNRLTTSTSGVSCTVTVSCGSSFNIDPSTNRLSTGGVSYGPAGNVTAFGAYQYGYDGEGMMSSLTSPMGARYDYIYTADGERVATYIGNGTGNNNGNWQFTIRGLDGKVLREITAFQPSQGAVSWTWDRDHVWRDGQLLATVSPSGTEQFHIDHLGTPRVVTSASGQRIGYHAYYPFGEELNLGNDESPLERLKFTGHERDTVQSASLDYMHARYDSATMGRFLSVDPVLGYASQPQTWNRYSYVENNPIQLADPTGRCPTCVFEEVAEFLAEAAAEEAQKEVAKSATRAGLSWFLVFANMEEDTSNTEGKPTGDTTPQILGANGQRVDSKTLWPPKSRQNEDGTRVDVENPAPGKREGQVQIQREHDGETETYSVQRAFDSKSRRWGYRIAEPNGGSPAPKWVKDLLNDDKVRDAILRGMQRYLNEPDFNFARIFHW